MAIAIPFGSPALPEGAAAATVAGTGAWPWPLLGEVITPYRNGNDPYAAGQHRGLDIAAPAGTRVHAVVDGRVSFSGRLPDGGQTVTVRSAEGRYLVSSLHLATRSVTRGERVTAGTVLGSVGETGRRSASQPHLHLSVRSAADRRYVDPLSLLGMQRVVEAPAKPAVAEKLTALEPAAKQSHARPRAQAPTRGGASVRSHAAEVTPPRIQPAAARREGRASSGATESRAAPPPLEAQPAETPSAKTPSVAAPVVSQPEVSERSATQRARPPVDRLLVLGIAGICLVALVLRRRTPGTAPSATPTPAAEAEPVENVVPLHKAS